MGILPNCSSVSTTVWLHHLNLQKTLREKSRWELNKDAVYCFEQIQEASPYKTAAIRPLVSNLTYDPNKTRKICKTSSAREARTNSEAMISYGFPQMDSTIFFPQKYDKYIYPLMWGYIISNFKLWKIFFHSRFFCYCYFLSFYLLFFRCCY